MECGAIQYDSAENVSAIQSNKMMCDTVQCGYAVQYDMVQYFAVWYIAVHYNAVWCGAIKHGAMQCCAINRVHYDKTWYQKQREHNVIILGYLINCKTNICELILTCDWPTTTCLWRSLAPPSSSWSHSESNWKTWTSHCRLLWGERKVIVSYPFSFILYRKQTNILHINNRSHGPLLTVYWLTGIFPYIGYRNSVSFSGKY